MCSECLDGYVNECEKCDFNVIERRYMNSEDNTCQPDCGSYFHFHDSSTSDMIEGYC